MARSTRNQTPCAHVSVFFLQLCCFFLLAVEIQPQGVLAKTGTGTGPSEMEMLARAGSAKLFVAVCARV